MTDILMIHGYNHDPDDPDHSPSRPGGNFDVWSRMLPDHNCIPFPWYSGRQWVDTFAARAAGYRTSYGWAYGALAVDAAARLVTMVDNMGLVYPNIVCHSLGTRVALLAIQSDPDRFEGSSVLMLNGAEMVDVGMPIINDVHTCFLNIAVREDGVLEYMGENFAPGDHVGGCIGNGCPAGARRLVNFDEIILDDDFDKQFFLARCGWDLEGDGPSQGDHSYSFLREANWPLFRKFFTDGGIYA
jgi:hypothetical protein